MKKLHVNQLKTICFVILERMGVPEDEAEIVTDALLKANLRGVDSHGISCLIPYVNKVEKRTIIPGAPFTIVRETSSTALVDGGFGFGQVMAVKAMKLAIDKARSSGLGGIAVYNTNHVGMPAYYVMIAIENQMIGFATLNTSPLVAPWGGKIPLLGTNPIAIGIPSRQKFPLILDMATSAIAHLKVGLAAKKRERIPVGCAIDKNGEPTTDPVAVLEGGALLPFGGPKGYGIALMVDILSGALSGMACGKAVQSMYPLEGKSNSGQFYLAINIDDFTPLQDFKAKVDDLCSSIKSCPPAPGFSEVLIPGEIEYRTEQKRLHEGIPIDDETWQSIEALCNRFSIDLSSINSALALE
jgi:LDH2 family malate/lactate/ureidoglycolate dehydrogenase